MERNRRLLLLGRASTLALAIAACANPTAPVGTGAQATPAPSTPIQTSLATPGQGPRARGYLVLLGLKAEDGVWLAGGWTASPPSGGVELSDSWTLRTDPAWLRRAELPRFSDVMAYDAGSDRVVVPTEKETLVYDPKTDQWTKRAVAIGPADLSGARGVYDSESDRIIVLTRLGETWAFDLDTDTWKNMSPATSPTGRTWYMASYDAAADRVIVFGGVGRGELSDTWAYDFNTNTWTEMTPAKSPVGRKYGAMAYEPKSGRSILFGGAFGPQARETPLGDTWSYDFRNNTWTEISATPAPSARAWHAMADNPATGTIVLFGGGPHRDRYQSDTWIYDGTRNMWAPRP